MTPGAELFAGRIKVVVVDRFYTALFSALELLSRHTALACDST